MQALGKSARQGDRASFTGSVAKNRFANGRFRPEPDIAGGRNGWASVVSETLRRRCQASFKTVDPPARFQTAYE